MALISSSERWSLWMARHSSSRGLVVATNNRFICPRKVSVIFTLRPARKGRTAFRSWFRLYVSRTNDQGAASNAA
jgi:hypothetical protein